MLSNYVKVIARLLWRNKIYSSIIILGLAIGLASYILIRLYAINELSFDEFHDNNDRICRVTTNGFIGNSEFEIATSSAAVAENIVNDFPEVSSATRVSRIGQPVLITIGDKKFYEDEVLCVDSTFLEIFSFKLINGDPSTVFDAPNSLVITESTAKKYFGDKDPLNEQVQINNREFYTITGLVKDVPDNSHLRFSVLSPFEMLKNEYQIEYEDNWGYIAFYTYVLLTDNSVFSILQQKLPGYINQYMEDATMDIRLQPLLDIHLRSNLQSEVGITGSYMNVVIFLIIGYLIVFIACFNYINLTIAKSASRQNEIAMRRAHGASRSDLIKQFVGESVAFTFLGLISGILIIWLIVPIADQWIKADIIQILRSNLALIPEILLFTIAIGVAAGLYPAFHMIRFKSKTSLRIVKHSRSGHAAFRNALIALQMTISLVLIVTSILIIKQIRYLSTKDLGYDFQHLLVIPLHNNSMRQKVAFYKSELANLPFVANVSASTSIPGDRIPSKGFLPEGFSDDERLMIAYNNVDEDFEETLNLTILSGRGLSEEYSTDTFYSAMINEALLHKIGWEDPLDKIIREPTRDGERALKIIGVVKDFNFLSLHEQIRPLILFMNPGDYNYLSVRITERITAELIHEIKTKWGNIESLYPFEYSVLSDRLEKGYIFEKSLLRLLILFSIVAICISSMGVYGLSLFTTEQYSKDIAIRKVFGSSVERIILLYSSNFNKLLILACLISWPLAWYFTNSWLKRFEYKIPISWTSFLLSGVFLFLLINMLTGIQIFLSSRRNAAQVLKYE